MECPNCGKIAEDNSLFCENCGTRLNPEIRQEIPQNVSSPIKNDGFKAKKIRALKIFGILAIIIGIISVFGSIFHVRMINEDRLMLYPMLSLLLSFYCSFKLIEYEETFVIAEIIVIVSTLLFIVGVII
ncbi:MAG: zinc ribbon domain-containing protein [Methanobrevibacter sp.]|nr:zinc ribbon domain-containing protein [Methanobrevibacter sp.]